MRYPWSPSDSGFWSLNTAWVTKTVHSIRLTMYSYILQYKILNEEWSYQPVTVKSYYYLRIPVQDMMEKKTGFWIAFVFITKYLNYTDILYIYTRGNFDAKTKCRFTSQFTENENV